MIQVKSINDVITNSSSECFIIKNKDLDKIEVPKDIKSSLTRIGDIDELVGGILGGTIKLHEYIEAFGTYGPSLDIYRPSKRIQEVLKEFGHTKEEIDKWEWSELEKVEKRNKETIKEYMRDPRIIETTEHSFIWNYGEKHDLMKRLRKLLKKNNIKFREISW